MAAQAQDRATASHAPASAPERPPRLAVSDHSVGAGFDIPNFHSWMILQSQLLGLPLTDLQTSPCHHCRLTFPTPPSRKPQEGHLIYNPLFSLHFSPSFLLSCFSFIFFSSLFFLLS
jgi:hypothetical protein